MVETETVSDFPTEKHVKSTLMKVGVGEGKGRLFLVFVSFFANCSQNKEFLLSCSYRINIYWLVSFFG